MTWTASRGVGRGAEGGRTRRRRPVAAAAPLHLRLWLLRRRCLGFSSARVRLRAVAVRRSGQPRARFGSGSNTVRRVEPARVGLKAGTGSGWHGRRLWRDGDQTVGLPARQSPRAARWSRGGSDGLDLRPERGSGLRHLPDWSSPPGRSPGRFRGLTGMGGRLLGVPGRSLIGLQFSSWQRSWARRGASVPKALSRRPSESIRHRAPPGSAGRRGRPPPSRARRPR